MNNWTLMNGHVWGISSLTRVDVEYNDEGMVSNILACSVNWSKVKRYRVHPKSHIKFQD